MIILLAWLIATASLKHVYLAAWLVGLALWQTRDPRRQRGQVVVLVTLITLTLAYGLISGNVHALIDQAYRFNAVYYPPFATSPGEPLPQNPIDTLVLTVGYWLNAQRHLLPALLVPFAAFALFGLGLLAASLWQRRWFQALALTGLLALSYPTSEPVYRFNSHFIAHDAVLVAVSVVAVGETWRWRRVRWIVLGLWMLCLLPLTALLPLTPLRGAPADVAVMRSRVREGESVWMAPAEFDAWLVTDAPNAARPYYFIYPWLWADPTIRRGVLERLEVNRPAVILYRRDLAVAGVPEWTLAQFAPDLTAWVDANYRSLDGHPDLYVRRDD